MSSSIPASGTEHATAPAEVGAPTAARAGAPAPRAPLRALRRHPTLVAGAICLVFIALSAFGAHLWGTSDPQALHPIARLHAPSSEQWFGTDQYGRDIYSRTLYGGRISLLVGATVGLASLAFGVSIGLVGGYYRRVDAIVMRVMDGLMAIPAILLALALMALMRASVQNVILALTVPEIPRVVRLVRASVLSLREQTMVEGARAIGARTPRILVRYVLPALVAPLIVQGTYICASAILFEAYLSFLGAGTPPIIPSWGNIMAEGRAYVQRAFWIILFPGAFLAATVLAVNLVGDGLRDLLKVR
jgi:peptide/nickel transport system permease protein